LEANGEAAKRWLSQAEHDLAASEASRAAGHHEWACFQAQQAAEKALKAFLYAHGERDVHLHSIRALLTVCHEFDLGFDQFREAADLDQYYTPTRNPNGLPDTAPHEFYGEEHAERCLSHARPLLSFVTSLLRPPSD